MLFVDEKETFMKAVVEIGQLRYTCCKYICDLGRNENRKNVGNVSLIHNTGEKK